jgi:hypothetical protein
MKAAPEPFLQAIAPDREDLVVCVECLLTGYWLADLCARDGLPCVLGPALSRQAIHGGQATHDTSDAHQMAVLRRGGRLPQACVSPADLRATRDLLRRRMHRMRTRAAWLGHLHHITRQDNLPEIGQKLASKVNRGGVAERCPEPAVQKSIAVDLALSDDDPLLRDMELTILTTATQHDANTLYLLRIVPGMGEILSLVLRYEIHDSQRCPRVQDVVSCGRLVKCAGAAAGTRDGTSGTTIGHADVQWALCEAAVLCLRTNPVGQKYLARLAKQHGKGQALTVLAQKLARAVD